MVIYIQYEMSPTPTQSWETPEKIGTKPPGIKLCHSLSGLLPVLSLVGRDKRLYVLSMKTNFANLQIAYMLSYSFTCQNYQPVKQENSNPPIWLATMLLRKKQFFAR